MLGTAVALAPLQPRLLLSSHAIVAQRAAHPLLLLDQRNQSALVEDLRARVDPLREAAAAPKVDVSSKPSFSRPEPAPAVEEPAAEAPAAPAADAGEDDVEDPTVDRAGVDGDGRVRRRR